MEEKSWLERIAASTSSKEMSGISELSDGNCRISSTSILWDWWWELSTEWSSSEKKMLIRWSVFKLGLWMMGNHFDPKVWLPHLVYIFWRVNCTAAKVSPFFLRSFLKWLLWALTVPVFNCLEKDLSSIQFSIEGSSLQTVRAFAWDCTVSPHLRSTKMTWSLLSLEVLQQNIARTKSFKLHTVCSIPSMELNVNVAGLFF